MSLDKLVDSTQLDTDLTSVANAIRTKGGTSASLAFPAGFVQAIAAIPSGGGVDYDALVMRTVTGDIVLNTATQMYNNTVFRGCPITSISAPLVTTFNASGSMFRDCTSLVSFYFPELTTLYNANECWRGCTSLTAAKLPKVSNPGTSTFLGCTSLKTIVLPAIASNFGGTFAQGCTSLLAIDINHTGSRSMGANMFNGDSQLTTIVLRGSSVLALSNVNAFTGTPFDNGGAGGTIYVPSSLINSYKAASNWATINGYGTITWTAIEGSQYETKYVDGTTIPI